MYKVVCCISEDEFSPAFNEEVVSGDVFKGTFDECTRFLEEMLNTKPLNAAWEKYNDGLVISMGEAYDGPCDIHWSTITYMVEEV